jgi:acyl dehydratase
VALDASLIGRTYPPSQPYEVGREKIREFADAIGDPNPAYRDPEAAKALGHPDIIAPPTFPIIFALPACGVAFHDPDVGMDYSRVVHGEQQFGYTRPLRPGDRCVCRVTITAARTMAGNDILTVAAVVTSEEGEQLLTALSTIVARAPEEDPS